MTDTFNHRRCPHCGGYLTAKYYQQPKLRRCQDCGQVYDPAEERRKIEAVEKERLEWVTFRE